MDIITRLTNCLKSQENSATEPEIDKAIKSAIKHITELREALELVDDLGSFSNLLETDEMSHNERN